MKFRLANIYQIIFFLLCLSTVSIINVGCQKPRIGSKSSRRNKSEMPPKIPTHVQTWEENATIKSALDQKNYKRAQKIAERAIKKQPANHEAHYFLAKALEAQNKLEQALQYYERASTLAPENISYKKDFVNAILTLAKISKENKDIANSIQLCKKALSINPESESVKVLLLSNYKEIISRYKKQNKHEELETLLKEATNILPNHQLQLELAILYLEQDRVLEAENILKRIYTANPNYTDNNYWYAKLLIKIGDLKQAKEIVEKSLLIDPNSSDFISLKNEIEKAIPVSSSIIIEEFSESEIEFINKLYQLENEYNYIEITKLLTNYLKKYPNKDWAMLKLANTYEKLGEFQKCLNLAEKYLNQNPKDNRAIFCKARALHQLGKLDEALNLLQNLLSDISTNVQIYDELGQIYAKKGDFKKAEIYWKKALEISPDYANIYFNFAQLAMEQKKFNNAEELFKKAIDLDPYNPKFYFFAGLNYKSQGKEKEATEIWNSTLNWLNPQDPYANRILKALGKKDLTKSSLINLQTSTPNLQTNDSTPNQLTQEPQNLQTNTAYNNTSNQSQTNIKSQLDDRNLSTISQINAKYDQEYIQALEYARSGNLAKALEGLNNYLEKNPYNVNALINRGKVFTALQMPAKAICNYIQAIKLSSNNEHALELLVNELKELGMHKTASEYALKLININPEFAKKFPDYNSFKQLKNNPRAYDPLIKELIKNNLLDEAKSIVLTARDENPEDIKFMLLEADVRYVIQEYDKAESILKLAISQDPAEPMPYIKLGDLYYAKNLPEQAYQQYLQAQKSKYFNPDIGMDLIERYRVLKKYKEANALINQIKGMNLSTIQYQRLQNLTNTM